MKKLINCINRFIQCLNRCIRCWDWKDLTLFKVCLCSFGIFAGLCLPRKKRFASILLSGLLCAGTALPLVLKNKTLFTLFWKQEDSRL